MLDVSFAKHAVLQVLDPIFQKFFVLNGYCVVGGHIRKGSLTSMNGVQLSKN